VPEYARFHKCDLHMHSPVDHEWRDKDTKLHHNSEGQRKRQVASEYLRACHGAQLEIIAVVDHNFATEPAASLIDLLRELNEEVADEAGRDPIIVFPGFEVECRVGRGAHLVCIFEPDASLEIVDDAASKLLDQPRFPRGKPRPSDKNLLEVLKTVQDDLGGIVLGAHLDREKGLLDQKTAKDWWRQEEWGREDLYAVELSKPPEELDPSSFLGTVIANKHSDYRRRRPIACVLSSDCKRIAGSDEDDRNFVGFRSTWIKMSRPSVEGLRQAFLAQETHIRYDEQCPDVRYDYPRIQSVTAHRGFLEIPLLEFSPNLNCVIGGRGAGKSALVDAIRAAAAQVPGAMPKRVRDVVCGRLDKTATNAELKVGIRTRGGERQLRLCWTNAEDVVVLDEDSNEVTPSQLQVIFPAKFLSQGEIDALAEEPEQVSMLLDEFLEAELREIDEEESEVRSRLDQMQIDIEGLQDLVGGKGRVKTEIAEWGGKLNGLKDVSDRVHAWRSVKQADDTLATVQNLGKEADEVLGEALQRVSDVVRRCRDLPQPDSSHDEATADMRTATELLGAARCALSLVASQLRGAQEGLHRRLLGMGSPFETRLTQEWRPFFAREESSYEELKEELREQGLDPDEHEAVQDRLQKAQRSLRTIQGAEGELERKKEQRSKILAELHELWARKTEIRRERAAQLTEKLSGTLRIKVSHQSSWQDLAARLDEDNLWQDKRRLSEEDCRELLRHLRGHAQKEDIPIAEAFAVEMRELLQQDSGLVTKIWDPDDRRVRVLKEWFPAEVLETIRTFSVSDEVEITVYDGEGYELGDLAHVSTGQRGFAVLSLLLAEGEGPLVVDTPEEGLDNEGIYSLVVPMLREKKETRQILVVTHNANIPVNADAELIVALEAGPAEGEGVAGHIKALRAEGHSPEAIGALDRHEVRKAVVDIMEGSQDAFSRRRAKYGY